MNRIFSNANLYLVSLSLLATHEVDAGIWREWEPFGLPGGQALFLLINWALLLLFLYGFYALARRPRAGLVFVFLLAGVNIAVFAIHAYFLVASTFAGFRTWPSLVLLVLVLLIGIAQIAFALRNRGNGRKAPDAPATPVMPA